MFYFLLSLVPTHYFSFLSFVLLLLRDPVLMKAIRRVVGVFLFISSTRFFFLFIFPFSVSTHPFFFILLLFLAIFPLFPFACF